MKATAFALILALGCASAPPVPAAEPAQPTTPKPAPAEVTIIDGQLNLPAPITFVGDSATLTPESTPALTALRDYLAKRTDLTLLRIEGHLAASGHDALIMSGERAFAIGGWLRDQGIDCKRLLAAAFGNTKPIAHPDAPGAAAQNTRITLVPATLRGIAIGGMPVDGSASLSTNVCPE